MTLLANAFSGCFSLVALAVGDTAGARSSRYGTVGRTVRRCVVRDQRLNAPWQGSSCSGGVKRIVWLVRERALGRWPAGAVVACALGIDTLTRLQALHVGRHVHRAHRQRRSLWLKRRLISNLERLDNRFAFAGCSFIQSPVPLYGSIGTPCCLANSSMLSI